MSDPPAGRGRPEKSAAVGRSDARGRPKATKELNKNRTSPPTSNKDRPTRINIFDRLPGYGKAKPGAADKKQADKNAIPGDATKKTAPEHNSVTDRKEESVSKPVADSTANKQVNRSLFLRRSSQESNQDMQETVKTKAKPTTTPQEQKGAAMMKSPPEPEIVVEVENHLPPVHTEPEVVVEGNMHEMQAMMKTTPLAEETTGRDFTAMVGDNEKHDSTESEVVVEIEDAHEKHEFQNHPVATADADLVVVEIGDAHETPAAETMKQQPAMSDEAEVFLPPDSEAKQDDSDMMKKLPPTESSSTATTKETDIVPTDGDGKKIDLGPLARRTSKEENNLDALKIPNSPKRSSQKVPDASLINMPLLRASIMEENEYDGEDFMENEDLNEDVFAPEVVEGTNVHQHKQPDGVPSQIKVDEPGRHYEVSRLSESGFEPKHSMGIPGQIQVDRPERYREVSRLTTSGFDPVGGIGENDMVGNQYTPEGASPPAATDMKVLQQRSHETQKLVELFFR